jgi:hypothetical protein
MIDVRYVCSGWQTLIAHHYHLDACDSCYKTMFLLLLFCSCLKNIYRKALIRKPLLGFIMKLRRKSSNIIVFLALHLQGFMTNRLFEN